MLEGNNILAFFFCLNKKKSVSAEGRHFLEVEIININNYINIKLHKIRYIV